RVKLVTGVHTCALPISSGATPFLIFSPRLWRITGLSSVAAKRSKRASRRLRSPSNRQPTFSQQLPGTKAKRLSSVLLRKRITSRSEVRRVGRDGREGVI